MALTSRDYSNIQEKHIAKITGGKVQSNSGGTKFGGGDVHTNKFLLEAKTSMSVKQSFSIKREWLKKLKEQTFEQGKECGVLAFQFEPYGKNYYILYEEQFLEYLHYKENK